MAKRTVLPLVALVVLLSLAPDTVGAPALGGTLHAFATASTFSIASEGPSGSFEGGLARWNLVCGDCHVQVTFTEGFVVLVQDGEMRPLPPGAYVIDGFAGIVSHTQRAPHRFDLELHGVGRVTPL